MKSDWRVEVFSCLTDKLAEAPDPLAGLLEQISDLNKQLPPLDPTEAAAMSSVLLGRTPDPVRESSSRAVLAKLERLGLLACQADRVLNQVRAVQRGYPARASRNDLEDVLAFLTRCWKRPVPLSGLHPETHVFVGPPGAGKTTALSKWLAQAVLLGGRSARVFRLDGCIANTAEALSVYGEILGVPVDRAWPATPSSEQIQFVDLPGIVWQDADGVADLERRLQGFGPAQVHLVLNAAYEVSLLFSQIQAYADLPIADLIFTHLDEERQWGKLWNFVLGTNHAISFLSAGQNVPGNFLAASADKLLPDGFG